VSDKPPVWQLHDAEARLNDVFRLARTEGPQRVVKQCGEAVVVVSAEDFDRAESTLRQPASLVDFFRAAPTGGRPLDLRRKRDKTRTINR
jgi:prevent-host-death family protein